jgi:ADP-ribose pyrophosphatase YjhB (NUDIX family)
LGRIKGKEIYAQAGVIPYRTNEAGQLEVLLVRRVEKQKWGIPKGVAEPDAALVETARKEARDEAGVVGELYETPAGYFAFRKWGGFCHVTVFLMRVTEVLESYPEQDRRTWHWFPAETAASIARRKRLRELVAELPRLIREQEAGS